MLAWRLLHAGTFQNTYRPQARAAHHPRAGGTGHQPRRGCLGTIETLIHIFLACPTSSHVRAWVARSGSAWSRPGVWRFFPQESVAPPALATSPLELAGISVVVGPEGVL